MTAASALAMMPFALSTGLGLRAFLGLGNVWGWLTILDKVSRGLRAALTVFGMLGLERSRLCGMRARSVTRPFFNSILTMLFIVVCWPLNTWLGICPGEGQASITVLIIAVNACTLACFSELSCSPRALCKDPFNCKRYVKDNAISFSLFLCHTLNKASNKWMN